MADALDQLLAARASGASAPTTAPAAAPQQAASGDSLDALLSARASGQNIAAPVPASAAGSSGAAQTTAAGQLARQVGLTARAGVTGLTALPTMVGDALNSGINLGIKGINAVHDAVVPPTTSELITGRQPWIPELSMPSQAIQRGMNAIGIPQPQNATERVVQDAASAMAGTGPSVAAGKLIAKAASPVAQAVGQAMQTAPGAQIAGSAGAGAGSGTARELGLNPAWQVGAAMLGGGAGVLGGSLATSGVRAVANRVAPPPPIPAAAAASRADSAVERVIKDLGPQGAASFNEAPPVQPAQPSPPPTGGPVQPPPAPTASSQFGTFQPLKQQVAQALQQDPTVDPAAVIRANDFRNLGMDGTLGQITRETNQFARELNIRGTPTGAPLATRFNQQNAQLQQALGALTGTPSDIQSAGGAIKSSLKSIDDQMSQQVSDAYAAARASSGKNLDVPLSGVAQDYAQVLNDFGDKVPSGVRNNFEQLGLMGGTQRKTFSIENAENLLKVINDNTGSDQATNLALGKLRTSVKNAILSADDQGGVYAPARALAAQRFALQDQIPALQAASRDSVNADDFVRRFVLNGKTDEVNAMANLLREQAPDAFQEARSQIGSQLASKGFGVNPAGDARFNPSPYMSQMAAFGPAKLAAFYSPEELAQLNTIGRVGAYMNSHPSLSPVNTSNTAAAIGNLIAPGLKELPFGVGKLFDSVGNRMFVNRALAGRLSDTTVQQPTSAPTQRALGALLLNPAQRAPGSNR